MDWSRPRRPCRLPCVTQRRLPAMFVPSTSSRDVLPLAGCQQENIHFALQTVLRTAIVSPCTGPRLHVHRSGCPDAVLHSCNQPRGDHRDKPPSGTVVVSRHACSTEPEPLGPESLFHRALSTAKRLGGGSVAVSSARTHMTRAFLRHISRMPPSDALDTA